MNTRPEAFTDLATARRIRAQMYRCGGCGMCTKRVEGFGLFACSTEGRTFPLCIATPGASFELDHDTLKRAA